MTTENKSLYYLHELPDYKVADGYSDIRGWKVLGFDNRVIGQVAGLLVNKHAGRVVYLDVEVDEALIRNGFDTFSIPANEGVHGFLNSDGEDHIIIPVGMVSLDQEQGKVISSQIKYETFAATKRFGKNTDITREYELDVFNSYVPDATSENLTREDDLYNRRQFR